MPQFLVTWILTAISIVITAKIVPGLDIDSVTAAAIAAVVLGFVNAVVRPLLILFTLPLTILTLGLFLLVVNALSLGLVGYLTPGFTVGGFFPAAIGSLVLTFVSSVLDNLLGNDDDNLD